MAKPVFCDVAIIGGGMAGLSLSCLLGRAGLDVVCIDKAVPKPSADLRTTAISFGSRKILEEAGIWAQIKDACPIEDIRILDGNSPLLLQFLSDEVEGRAFGWIVLNSDLRAAMEKAVASYASVRVIAPAEISDLQKDNDHVRFSAAGRNYAAKLLIGADGRGSFIREWMDVPVRGRDYKQRAVICTAGHERPHHNRAVEHFWPEGPFAILPMCDDAKGGHRSAVVFTEHGSDKTSLMRFSDAEFEIALAARFPESYGAVRMIGSRAAYPLSLSHAAAYTAPRTALIADAAHGIHPIAGQGLNLGFRDVKVLADLVAESHRAGRDIGGADLLARYERARRFDNTSMVAVTDGLVRLFSNDMPPVRALRRAGLKIVGRLPAAKRFFMRKAMGE